MPDKPIGILIPKDQYDLINFHLKRHLFIMKELKRNNIKITDDSVKEVEQLIKDIAVAKETSIADLYKKIDEMTKGE